MKCKKCNSEMLLDDVDFNFEGNQDNYWLCEKCEIGCIEEIRFGRSFKTIWNDEE